MKISIVIPNYNGKEILGKNLPKILAATKDAEIIVVDDASTDDSLLEIKNQSAGRRKKIRIIQNEKNLGFTSSVNKGVREASGELVVLLNTDVVPQEDFLEASIKHFSDQKVFGVGFLQKCNENGKIILRGRGIGRFQKGFLVHSRGEVDKNNSLWISGGAGIFRKSTWMTLCGMETLYNPFYWEDIDLSYRALKAGYKLVFEPESVVYHQQEQGAIRSSYTQSEIKTIAYRNQIIFVWLNINDLSFLISHLFYLPYTLVKTICKGDGAFFKGLIQAIVKLPEIISKRSARNRFNKISDQMILAANQL